MWKRQRCEEKKKTSFRHHHPTKHNVGASDLISYKVCHQGALSVQRTRRRRETAVWTRMVRHTPNPTRKSHPKKKKTARASSMSNQEIDVLPLHNQKKRRPANTRLEGTHRFERGQASRHTRVAIRENRLKTASFCLKAVCGRRRHCFHEVCCPRLAIENLNDRLWCYLIPVSRGL
jgi:hypothetical protein